MRLPSLFLFVITLTFAANAFARGTYGIGLNCPLDPEAAEARGATFSYDIVGYGTSMVSSTITTQLASSTAMTGAGTITLSSVTGFFVPAVGGAGAVEIDAETFKYTGVSTTLKQLTGVTRAVNGTVAATHPANSVVTQVALPYAGSWPSCSRRGDDLLVLSPGTNPTSNFVPKTEYANRGILGMEVRDFGVLLEPFSNDDHEILSAVSNTQAVCPATADTTQINMGSGITAGSMSITVDSAAAFPPQGLVLIDSEVIEYSSRTDTVLTVATGGRGKLGTTATTHENDAVVRQHDYPFFSTSVASPGLTSSATTLNVGSTIGFPSAGALMIDSEKIYYTGTTASSFTGLLRGQLGTVAAAHAVGASVQRTVPSTDFIYFFAQWDPAAAVDSGTDYDLANKNQIAFGTGTWQPPSPTSHNPRPDECPGTADTTRTSTLTITRKISLGPADTDPVLPNGFTQFGDNRYGFAWGRYCAQACSNGVLRFNGTEEQHGGRIGGDQSGNMYMNMVPNALTGARDQLVALFPTEAFHTAWVIPRQPLIPYNQLPEFYSGLSYNNSRGRNIVKAVNMRWDPLTTRFTGNALSSDTSLGATRATLDGSYALTLDFSNLRGKSYNGNSCPNSKCDIDWSSAAGFYTGRVWTGASPPASPARIACAPYRVTEESTADNYSGTTTVIACVGWDPSGATTAAFNMFLVSRKLPPSLATPTSFTFEATTVGRNIVKTYTITNDGERRAMDVNVTITGSSKFNIVYGADCGRYAGNTKYYIERKNAKNGAPNTCTVTVTYVPTYSKTMGTHTDNAQISVEADNSMVVAHNVDPLHASSSRSISAQLYMPLRWLSTTSNAKVFFGSPLDTLASQLRGSIAIIPLVTY